MRAPLRFLLSVVLALLAGQGFLSAQNRPQQPDPVKWSYVARDAGNGQFDLVFTSTIDEGWYIYSQFNAEDAGPLPLYFTYQEGPHFKLVGKSKESGDVITAFDDMFGVKLTKIKHKGVFTQRVQILDFSKPVEGYVSYQTCNNEMCLPPKDVDFKFTLTPPAKSATDGKTEPAPVPAPDKTAETTPAAPEPTETEATGEAFGIPGPSPASPAHPARPDDPNFKGFFDAKRPINSAQFVNNCGIVEKKDASLLWVFVGGFLGGLLALLTPCVFPMIPMTVSFFVKKSKDRATGLRNALWYGSSIIVIYAGLGILLTSLFGATVLNELSTNMWFNVAFFVIFIVFALSFFGLFEITLPSSWVNKSDQMADKGGLIGIFFMAATLALVSFSCTGPIVGTLLVETVKTNAGEALFGFIPVRPTVGMFGFGLALAIPFALFAMFPSWLNSLPKSGGWMDNVKISLGLIEVALALKFLSTADMVSHWGLLKFELFLGLWLLLGLIFAAYQLGLLGWKGAKGRPYLGRLTAGLAGLAFAAYLGFGLFNYQSLSLLSGLAPPVHYNFFLPETSCPHGLNCYHDFDEGMAEARRQNKPLFVDFTGYGCVNCRKMEENVWHKPGIIDHLRDNYVVVSLFVDDKERLFPDNKFAYLLDPHTGDKIRTVGDKWSAFQVNNFEVSAQPYYVLMHHDGQTVLNQPTDYNQGKDPDAYKAFLDCGYDAFGRVSKGETKSMIGANE